jgi:hypothetical protein
MRPAVAASIFDKRHSLAFGQLGPTVEIEGSVHEKYYFRKRRPAPRFDLVRVANRGDHVSVAAVSIARRVRLQALWQACR